MALLRYPLEQYEANHKAFGLQLQSVHGMR